MEAKRADREATLVALYGSRGELCRHLGQSAEARHWEGQALALSDQLGNPAPLEYARRLNDLGELCRNMRELDQADRFLLDARTKAEALTEPDQGLRGEITGNLGVLRYDQKRYPEAKELLEKARWTWTPRPWARATRSSPPTATSSPVWRSRRRSWPTRRTWSPPPNGSSTTPPVGRREGWPSAWK